jgi:hypothetical protein
MKMRQMAYQIGWVMRFTIMNLVLIPPTNAQASPGVNQKCIRKAIR